MTARKTTAKANDRDNTTPVQTTILMFGSEKGGLGKTTVALVAAEQMTAANHPFFLVDADASTPNVGLTYRKEIYEQFRHQGVKDADLLPSIYNLTKAGDRAATSILEEQITFTGDNNDFFLADRIFDIAKTQDVAIVLPSQVASYVNRWLRQNDVVGLLADPDNTIKFVYYFITNGTSESLDLFEESVEAFGGKIPHVLVKNLGAPTNIRWNRFDEDGRVQALLDKYGFQSIFFPEILIAPEDKEKILSEYIQFGEAIASDWIPFSTKRRLTKCLKDATQALGSTGYIPYHPSYIPEISEAATTAASPIADSQAAVTDPTIEFDTIIS